MKFKEIAKKRLQKLDPNGNARKYLKRFMREDDGLELMEWAILIIIVVGLVAVAIWIGGMIKDKLTEAGNQIDQIGGSTIPGGPAVPPTT